MKKLFALICAILMLSGLAACGEPPKAPTGFSMIFHADHTGCDQRGTVTVSDDGITVEMSAPGGAKGLTFNYTTDGLCIDYAKLSTQANADYISSDSVPSALYRALAYLPEARYLGSENGADLFALPSPAHEATLTVQDGVPLSLSCPDPAIEFSFRPS